MNILLWRAWEPLYSFPATFSSLREYSIGGTCSQLLWHARNLTELGHHVQVLGASKEYIKEECVEFLGAPDKKTQHEIISGTYIRRPDVIVLEGGFDAAPLLRQKFPDAYIILVGQNIDRYGAQTALKMESFIDQFAFVSPGSLSYYCIHSPHLIHKFCLLRNIVPWESIYKDLQLGPIEEKVAWVGAWTKKGLRAWSETMAVVMDEFPKLRWELYGPSHGSHLGSGLPSHIFSGLDLPLDRIVVNDYPMPLLAQALASATVVLVSLGNETACISALDGHAVARPVLSGNDLIFKFNNPDGTGIRVFRRKERYQALSFLLRNSKICDSMGVAGREFIASERSEHNQRQDLSVILKMSEIRKAGLIPTGFLQPGKFEESLSYLMDRIQRKLCNETSKAISL